MNYLTLLTLFPKKINVTFIDATSNQVLSKRKILKEDLPEVFDKPTVLTLDNEAWQVLDAHPVSGDDFHYSKKLTLKVQRKEEFDKLNQRLLVPTISGISTTINGFAPTQWMQLQFLPVDMMPALEQDLLAITAILESGNNLIGYPSVYERNRSLNSLAISLKAFLELINVKDVENSGDYFIADSNGHSYYGIVENGVISSLALRRFEYVDDEFSLLTEKFQLMLVDWCNGSVIGL